MCVYSTYLKKNCFPESESLAARNPCCKLHLMQRIHHQLDFFCREPEGVFRNLWNITQDCWMWLVEKLHTWKCKHWHTLTVERQYSYISGYTYTQCINISGLLGCGTGLWAFSSVHTIIQWQYRSLPGEKKIWSETLEGFSMMFICSQKRIQRIEKGLQNLNWTPVQTSVLDVTLSLSSLIHLVTFLIQSINQHQWTPAHWSRHSPDFVSIPLRTFNNGPWERGTPRGIYPATR